MYGSVTLSIRSLFDAMVTNFEYVFFDKYERAHSIFLMIHLVTTHVFMLNYVIAVLTSIYQFMIGQGEYTYLALRYVFYKRYSLLFQNMPSPEDRISVKIRKLKEHLDAKHGQKYLSQLVIQPPPLNMVGVPFLPFILIKRTRAQALKILTFTTYWLINATLVFAFLGFTLLILTPVAYLKTVLSFITKLSFRRKRSFLHLLAFIAIGLLIFGLYTLLDTLNVIKCLSVEDNQQKIESKIEKLELMKRIQLKEIRLFNEVIYSIKSLHYEIERKSNQRK